MCLTFVSRIDHFTLHPVFFFSCLFISFSFAFRDFPPLLKLSDPADLVAFSELVTDHPLGPKVSGPVTTSSQSGTLSGKYVHVLYPHIRHAQMLTNHRVHMKICLSTCMETMQIEQGEKGLKFISMES